MSRRPSSNLLKSWWFTCNIPHITTMCVKVENRQSHKRILVHQYLPRTKKVIKSMREDSTIRTRSSVHPLHLDSQNTTIYVQKVQKMDTNTKLWLLQVFNGSRAKNLTARVKLIKHPTTEQSDTWITQLLRFGVSRPVLRAEDSDFFSTLPFAVSVWQTEYFH